jgi:hypothetical protein
VVLCLSHHGACADSFENFRENSLKGDLSNDITLNPPLFSLVNTFKNTQQQHGSSKHSSTRGRPSEPSGQATAVLDNQSAVLVHQCGGGVPAAHTVKKVDGKLRQPDRM